MDQNLYFQRGIQIITKLNEITPQAYLIGGVVRDYLLKVPFNDIDIATSATPEQVLELFPNAIQEFADYGCITIKEDDMIFEITTFREEVYAKKSRKPSEIHYSRKLLDDINRRDFTINALAMPKSLVLVDLVGGEKDLKNKVIRTIGNPKTRFKEDPLRILRGLELMAKLGFIIEKTTLKGMIKRRKNLNEVANVKLTAELSSIFNHLYGKKTVKLMVKKQLFKYVNNYHYWLKLILKKYDKLTTLEKFTILCKMNPSVLDNSCFSKETINKIKEIIEISNLLENRPLTEYEVYKYETADLISADIINAVMIKKYNLQTKLIESLSENKVITSRNEIVITPQGIIDLADGKTGPFINDIMIQLEKDITTGKIGNTFIEVTNRTKDLLKTYDILNEPRKVEPVADVKIEKVQEVVTNNPVVDEKPTITEVENKQVETINQNPVIETKTVNYEKQNSVENSQQEDDIRKLLEEYNKEYKLMLDRKMLSAIDESMSLSEINAIKEDLKATTRLLTIKANPKFEILLEKGLI